MARASRSSKLFCERAGLTTTWRGPRPTYSPSDHPARTLPLAAPLPPPEFVVDGDPPPDRGLTATWPEGAAGIVAAD